MSEIVVDVPGEGVTRITLSRPQALNAFTFDMYARLIDILRALERNSKTRVVILTGAGKGFCAGHDLKSAGTPPWIDDPDLGKQYLGKHSISEIGLIPTLIRRLPQTQGLTNEADAKKTLQAAMKQVNPDWEPEDSGEKDIFSRRLKEMRAALPALKGADG